MWHLYLLECEGGSLYTGISKDVEARFRAHLRGKGAKYTRANPPLRVLASMAFPSRAAASKAEYAVKSLRLRDKHILLLCLPAYRGASGSVVTLSP